MSLSLKSGVRYLLMTVINYLYAVTDDMVGDDFEIPNSVYLDP